MRATEGILAAAPVPGPAHVGGLPSTVLLTVPAHLSFLSTIRTAVCTVVREIGGASACGRDLELAADEAAAVLIVDATPWTEVQLVIAHDEEDLYVRIVARRALPSCRLVVHELTQLLLGSVVQSYEIFAEGQLGYAFLQTPLERAGALP